MSSKRSISITSSSRRRISDDKNDVQEFGKSRYSRLSLPNRRLRLRSSINSGLNRIFKIKRDESHRRCKSSIIRHDKASKRKTIILALLRRSFIVTENDENPKCCDETELENDSFQDEQLELDEQSDVFSQTDQSHAESKEPNKKWKFEQHYFWGSRRILQIYSALAVAMLCRQVWFAVYGVLLILSYQIFEIILHFVSHYSDSHNYKTVSKYSARFFNNILNETTKTIEGDVLRILITRQIVKRYSKKGTLFVQSYLRMQMQRINTSTVSETREMIKYSEMSRLNHNSHLLVDDVSE